MTFARVRLLVDDFHGCFHFLQDNLGLECTFVGEDDGFGSFEAGTRTFVEHRRDDPVPLEDG